VKVGNSSRCCKL